MASEQDYRVEFKFVALFKFAGPPSPDKVMQRLSDALKNPTSPPFEDIELKVSKLPFPSEKILG